MGIALSVVVVTRDRWQALERLLADLAQQELPGAGFEVVIVDDGSVPPVRPRLEGLTPPYGLKVLAQTRAGRAAGRRRGVLAAEGETVLLLDDDLRLRPGFLAAHLRAHDQRPRAVVTGVVVAEPGAGNLPLVERARVTAHRNRRQAHGGHLCPDNFSLRRDDYLALGEPDAAPRDALERAVGIRLEQQGVPLVVVQDATAYRDPVPLDAEAWVDAARRAGADDLRVHRELAGADDTAPWRLACDSAGWVRPLLWLAAARPDAGAALTRGTLAAAAAADVPLLHPLAEWLATVAHGTGYFCGAGEAAGSLGPVLRGLAAETARRGTTERAGVGLKAAADFLDATHQDFAQACFYRDRYHADAKRPADVGRALVEQIGFQMMTAVRLMQFARNAGWPLGARVCSRLIRHLYGAEIHWDTVLEPGVCVVHGLGLVLGHQARVDAGCILFHNVTLGEALHPDTQARGSPHLERGVHVGPGATLLGPITIGEGSKIAAGCVVTRSVPPGARVLPAEVVLARRRPPPTHPGTPPTAHA
ncbi:MAG: glycosyltransferase [Deltaproteobacteria bacterium]|nr:glycosyltransferase [Deltaproteobacteria bacterium]